jgi:hypothetical protein
VMTSPASPSGVPTVSRIDGPVRAAVIAALATGIEQHGPDAVGIALKGIPVCLFAIAGHYLLDMSELSTVLSLSGATVGYGLAGAVPEALHRRDKRKALPHGSS